MIYQTGLMAESCEELSCPYNSYYTYSFDVKESYVSRVEVYVKNPEESTYIQYDVENVKYYYSVKLVCV